MATVTRYTCAVRRLLMAIWLAVVAGAGFVYLFHRDLLEAQIEGALTGSALAVGAIYLLLGAVRGFTLIPSTYLMLAAIPFFPPGLLLGLTLAGIVVSSASIYWFSDAMRLNEVFEPRYPRQVARLRALLARYELPVIVAWSFFPLAPTDLIVYVCGALRINAAKCLVGVAIGECAISAIYIYLGDALLRSWHLRA
jgi:uncharacterized membrane protein YdjX (TVP38/TMEM64 family)